MIKALVIVGVFVGTCFGIELKPYNVTALIMFHGDDTNADGCITRLELDTIFNKYDTNGNGKESRHEYTEFICAATPTLYNLSHYLYDEYDSDNDHQLEQHDYDALFAKMNPNGDGCIVEQEFVDYWVVIFAKYENVGTHGQTHGHGHSACH